MSDVATASAPQPDASPDLFGGQLPITPRPAAGLGGAASQPRVGAGRRGISPMVVLLAIVAVVAILWGAWMTKAVSDLKAHKTPIAAVHLQPLIEEYVQAQARSGTPQQLVMRQTQAFMGALEGEIDRRAKRGETVLVAEAVLSKNVPDITAEVRRAVYAKVEAPAPGPQAQAMPGAMPSAMMAGR